ncbi:hypothetical protein QE152_g29851 [Popillia japonica]|uniref:Uncharacterized protein n=1 Tax=Popillia japonica TaxID=7064 RepID=A0AAW1JGE8_POPJA
MALIGTIEPFKGNSEEFESYLERIEHLFKVNVVLEDMKVNVVLEDMKVSMFITLTGSSVYQTLKNLAAPRKPVELTYEEVTSLLSKHYARSVSEIYERFIFNKCVQKSDQSIAEYFVELRLPVSGKQHPRNKSSVVKVYQFRVNSIQGTKVVWSPPAPVENMDESIKKWQVRTCKEAM